ncbi:SpoIIE family protein phosphatase [Anaerosacchariphilus polymeriproducens]|uniref:Stage II sporulation protein E n=1 Tax=Anaerosacchariphilus polymeriproducens TaxID=1812858 RepID=A0A371AYD5_9FIRM|nr:SpoIIE family protein phosphatase [Anaerosacchariphilus polymeriproducens]RDU24490.1 stage II sporulation protein E [Anaerosacchariphilus polymeriproducens]
MKKGSRKKLIICLIGGIIGNIPVAGCYPLGLAYFIAVYMEQINRSMILPITLLGMSICLQPIEVIKYGLCMIVTMILVGLIEEIDKTCSRFVGAAIGGISISVLAFAGNLLQENPIFPTRGILEGIFVFCFAILLGRLLQWVVFSKQENMLELLSENQNREKLRRYADSYFKLSKTISTEAKYKQRLTNDDIHVMFEELAGKVCHNCNQCALCWEKNYQSTYQRTFELLEQLEQYGRGCKEKLKLKLGEYCICQDVFIEEAIRIFEQAKLNMSWYNRLIENREIIAKQLSETAEMMLYCSRGNKDITQQENLLVQQIKRRLASRYIQVKEISIMETDQKRREIHLTASSKRGICIPVKDIADEISDICQLGLVPSLNSKTILNKTYTAFVFEEEPKYYVVQGVARRVKDGEQISGDNFSFIDVRLGESVMSLSDGMGSGTRACKESETVIELLEKLLDAGFEKETAIQMINSAMVLQGDDGSFSTVDLSAVNLYSGVCEFLKIGASTTFIRRRNCVEAIQSTNLPIGIFHQIEVEKTLKKLYGGEYIIMVSDGVIEAIPRKEREMVMKDIIVNSNANHPKEIAEMMIEQVLEYSEQKILDDMTVLVCGIWEKV